MNSAVMRMLVRRSAVLLVNLIAVTVVVFLIGRLLPGGAMPLQDVDGRNVGSQEPAWQQWYARRYGLDQPLHRQYMRWWQSMFVAEQDVLLWTDEQPPRPIYRAVGESDNVGLFVGDGESRWQRWRPTGTTTADIEFESTAFEDALAAASDIDSLQRLQRAGRGPVHRIVAGQPGPSDESVDAAQLVRAVETLERLRVTLGRSRMTNRTVVDELAQRLPVTMLIGLLSMMLMYLLAVPLGVMSATARGGWRDRVIHAATMLVWSLPMVLTATLLLGVVGRSTSARWMAIALAVVVLALPGVAYVARQVRAAVAEQLDADFMRTAMAKGLSRSAAVRRHALRPASIVVITLLATVLPVVIGGSVIVESVFGIDGMGRFVYQAVINRDYDVVQSFTVLAAAANMAGLLAADIVYGVLDPRMQIAGKDVRQ